MGKGINGLVLKAMRADDYRLTVTSVSMITDKYVRIGFASGGLLADHPVHPTQWIRIWFADAAGKEQQRGYTLVDPNPAEGTFDIEFALHGGPASQWAQSAVIGDVLEATVLGSKFAVPEKVPSEYLIFGDTASLPAINSLLDAIGDVPARVWLEWQFESDKSLPVRNGSSADVTWLERVQFGQLLRQQAEQLECKPDAFAWVACDGATTRSITKTLKTQHNLEKHNIKAQAYWK
ncbi:siderophore-interacting protein [Antrihabitans cavernicola]|uniref:Siderophore-interacting protein n=1 Tax=Antrihabitans cavernicola TaxID=2495913 RepID=A0A5A7SAJ4_9NOCA|nr:siderophore-interacting protein [Spelaeibacter cavernicola]KAA0021545.1 siderophore-interacting protein [Spelaeibacter cavernicola]